MGAAGNRNLGGLTSGCLARRFRFMKSAKSPERQAEALSVFGVACWVLGLMAFCQLLVAGVALSRRFDASRQARTVVKEVVKYVSVPAAPSVGTVVSRPPPPVLSLPLPSPTPLAAPQVADPISERLVKEARKARVAGDMMAAITKLDQALSQSAEDATILYELGLVHEQMGVNDKAAAYYEKVFQLGLSGAGSLYELAAGKLRDGFKEETALGKLSLGRVRIFKDPDDEAGQRVVLSIPVQKAPGEEIEVADLAVSVSFFNRSAKGEISQLEDKSWVSEKWVSLPFDWTGGEETLRMDYVIPPQDSQTEHLFGERTYYGQVVSLMYQGEVLDVQAWPRDLAAKISQKAANVNPGDPVLPEFQDMLPSDFDPSIPLLPTKPKSKP